MMKRTQQRFIATLLLVLLTACHSWQPTTVSPQGWTPEERPSSVRVTLTNGEFVTVENPTVRNDSIVGVAGSDVGVASRDVRLFEVRRVSFGASIGVGLFASVAVLFGALLAACAGDNFVC